MKDRHWKRLANVTGYLFDVESPTFTLRNVMEAPLLKYKDDVEDICISAVKGTYILNFFILIFIFTLFNINMLSLGSYMFLYYAFLNILTEKDIEAKLKQVIADWAVVELSFSNFKSRGELLLKGTETGEIITILEDSLMIMNSLLSNR